MPLQYDDIPGSWGIYSRAWPCLTFTTEEGARRAYVACTKENVVPYGSYVLCGLELRVETEAYKHALAVHLVESPLKTTDAVLEEFNRINRT